MIIIYCTFDLFMPPPHIVPEALYFAVSVYASIRGCIHGCMPNVVNTITWQLLDGFSPNWHQWCTLGLSWTHQIFGSRDRRSVTESNYMRAEAPSTQQVELDHLVIIIIQLCSSCSQIMKCSTAIHHTEATEQKHLRNWPRPKIQWYLTYAATNRWT